jgi:hypothetical protein
VKEREDGRDEWRTITSRRLQSTRRRLCWCDGAVKCCGGGRSGRRWLRRGGRGGKWGFGRGEESGGARRRGGAQDGRRVAGGWRQGGTLEVASPRTGTGHQGKRSRERRELLVREKKIQPGSFSLGNGMVGKYHLFCWTRTQ